MTDAKEIKDLIQWIETNTTGKVVIYTGAQSIYEDGGECYQIQGLRGVSPLPKYGAVGFAEKARSIKYQIKNMTELERFARFC